MVCRKMVSVLSLSYIMRYIGGMRRREDEHTIEYNFPWNQTKGFTPWPVYNADLQIHKYATTAFL